MGNGTTVYGEGIVPAGNDVGTMTDQAERVAVSLWS